MRNALRLSLVAGLTGTLMVTAAWAGIVVAPVPTPAALPGGLEAVASPAEGGARDGDGDARGR